MNALKPLAFEDASFDLINMRFIAAFMHQEMWPKLFLECRRLLRPGGMLRITVRKVAPNAFGSEGVEDGEAKPRVVHPVRIVIPLTKLKIPVVSGPVSEFARI